MGQKSKAPLGFIHNFRQLHTVMSRTLHNLFAKVMAYLECLRTKSQMGAKSFASSKFASVLELRCIQLTIIQRQLVLRTLVGSPGSLPFTAQSTLPADCQI